MQQLKCNGCGHSLSKNMHDKCAYCGTPYPDQFRTTATEKEAILSDLEDRNEEEILRSKQRKHDLSPEGTCGGFYNNSDSGDGD